MLLSFLSQCKLFFYDISSVKKASNVIFTVKHNLDFDGNLYHVCSNNNNPLMIMLSYMNITAYILDAVEVHLPVRLA